MAKVKVTCDSTCDLTAELVQQYDITVLPLYVTMGDAQYRDGVDVNLKDVFEFVKQSGQLPKTAAVAMGDYIDCFTQLTADGSEVVHINLSSSLSASHNNAKLAAEEVEGVYPVDSKSLSTGSGLLVLYAAQLAQQGKSAKEIAQELEAKREKVEASFVVDTLEYLRKGGRCSSVAALGANLLKLKPCIEVTDGAMGVGKKYRGKIDVSILQYVKERLEGREDIDTSCVFITHTYAEEELVQAVRAEVAKYQHFDQVLESVAGCTIGSHCGKGTLGILFFRK